MHKYKKRREEDLVMMKDREYEKSSSFENAVLLFHKSIDTYVSLSFEKKKKKKK
jgi:hypothetical protein